MDSDDQSSKLEKMRRRLDERQVELDKLAASVQVEVEQNAKEVAEKGGWNEKMAEIGGSSWYTDSAMVGIMYNLDSGQLELGTKDFDVEVKNAQTRTRARKLFLRHIRHSQLQPLHAVRDGGVKKGEMKVKEAMRKRRRERKSGGADQIERDVAHDVHESRGGGGEVGGRAKEESSGGHLEHERDVELQLALVVEDDDALLPVFEGALKREGYEVVMTNNAEEARRLLGLPVLRKEGAGKEEVQDSPPSPQSCVGGSIRNDKFDVILLDNDLARGGVEEGEKGDDLARAIRDSDTKHANVPIISISARSTPPHLPSHLYQAHLGEDVSAARVRSLVRDVRSAKEA
uniref:Response regulatory domain-containing protein n=1 Tax=Palpitomonas bilix TaxID=652834 RepID=A0A7S3GH45_9EUKA|mmetsp:Transcript_49336/g.127202  ORF Transcript_49336/g.127202 Transcript_49336/m.127202 type:complete len:345 (+) Transcript_49336:267-1301(+)